MPKISERLQKYDAIFYDLFHYKGKTILGMFDETIRSELYRQHYRLCDKDSYTPELEETIDALLELFPGNSFTRRFEEGLNFQHMFVCNIPEINRKILQYRYEHVPSLTFAEIGRKLGMTGESVKYHFNKTIDLYERYLREGHIYDEDDELDNLFDELRERCDDFLDAAVDANERELRKQLCLTKNSDEKLIGKYTKLRVNFIKKLLAQNPETERTRRYRYELMLIWEEAYDRELYENDGETRRVLLAKRDELCEYLLHEIPDEFERMRAYYGEFSEYATKLFERRRL